MEIVNLEFRRQFDDALGSGDMFALFERTREAIELFPDDPDARYLQALAMARLGDPEAALLLYERNRVGQIGTEDAAALKGRLLKDLAVRATGTEQIDLFRQSSEAYRLAHQLTGGYFSGINAATTSFLAGDEEDARAFAAEIGRRDDIIRPSDYFAAASGAEAALVCGCREGNRAVCIGSPPSRCVAGVGSVNRAANQPDCQPAFDFGRPAPGAPCGDTADAGNPLLRAYAVGGMAGRRRACPGYQFDLE